MHRRGVLSLFVMVLLAATVAAQTDKVDEYVKAQMGQQRIPGLSLAVVKEGQVIKAKGYGLANVEHNIPATPETVYRIGSVSKQFIATGIVLLAEDGKLTLDDKINQYLEGAPDAWKEITLRHLLTHTSGLAREAPGYNPYRMQTEAEVIKTGYSLPLRFAPGEKWEYCNLGYFILAEIVHKVSGKPWGEFMDERVFKPLGMTATRPTSLTDIVPNRADGYSWRNDRMQNADLQLAMRPSGAFLSTVLDMSKWDAALYTDQILKQPVREQMWKPVAPTSRASDGGPTQSYGLGWFIDQVNRHRLVFHGGSQPGFRAVLERFIDDKLTVVVLTNAESANPDAIARGVAAFYISGLAANNAR